jgi:predicted PurR-regulated permease PerM
MLAFMRAAEAFLIPLLFAILLSYTFAPAVSALERVRLPRSLGALLILLLFGASTVALVYALSKDFGKLTELVPQAAAKLRLVLREQTSGAPKPLENLQKAATELDKAAAEATGSTPAPAAPKVARTEGSVAAGVQQWVIARTTQVAATVVQIGTAMLIAYFLLAAGDEFRRKIARLAGPSLARRRVAVSVLNEINVQIQRYMAVTVLTNCFIALLTWGVLAYLEIEHALFLGVFAGVAHFIPYIGSWIGAAMVGVVALVQVGDPQRAIYIALGVLAVITLIGFVLTTWLQSRASRVNAVVVVAGVLFFGWLWEGWGLILAMPVIVAVKSIADGIEPWQPLAEFLSSGRAETVS